MLRPAQHDGLFPAGSQTGFRQKTRELSGLFFGAALAGGAKKRGIVAKAYNVDLRLERNVMKFPLTKITRDSQMIQVSVTLLRDMSDTLLISPCFMAPTAEAIRGHFATVVLDPMSLFIKMSPNSYPLLDRPTLLPCNVGFGLPPLL